MKILKVIVILVLNSQLFAQDFINVEDEDTEGVRSFKLPTNDTVPDSVRKSNKVPYKSGSSSTAVKQMRTGEVFYSPVFYDYKLTASAGNSINFSTTGHKLQALYNWKFHKNSTFIFSGSYLMYKFTSLSSSITPNSLNGKTLTLKGFYCLHVFQNMNDAENSEWLLLFGYRYSNRSNDLNSPVQMTDLKTHSVGLGIQRTAPLFDETDLLLSLVIYPYSSVTESQAKTGNHDSSLIGDFMIKTYTAWTEKMKWSLMYEYSTEKNKFSGSGTRGLTNAEIKHMKHSVGLGLKYAF